MSGIMKLAAAMAGAGLIPVIECEIFVCHDDIYECPEPEYGCAVYYFDCGAFVCGESFSCHNYNCHLSPFDCEIFVCGQTYGGEVTPRCSFTCSNVYDPNC